jgi:ferredoxin-nitrate reductase
MSYAKLTGKSGIQWPCNEQFPDGARHLYVNGHFNTDPE